MQSVGKLDHDDADILRHGKEHLPQILRLHLQFFIGLIHARRGQRNFLQLCHTVDEQSDILAELPAQIVLRHGGVLDHVMQKSRNDGLLIQLQISQYNRHIQRVDDIGLTGFPELVLMCLSCRPVCLLDHGNVVARMIFPHTLNKLLIQVIGISEFLRFTYSVVLKDNLILFLCHSCPTLSLSAIRSYVYLFTGIADCRLQTVACQSLSAL